MAVVLVLLVVLCWCGVFRDGLLPDDNGIEAHNDDDCDDSDWCQEHFLLDEDEKSLEDVRSSGSCKPLPGRPRRDLNGLLVVVEDSIVAPENVVIDC